MAEYLRLWLRLVFLTIIALCGTFAEEDQSSYRLPASTKPTHYRLKIAPAFNDFTFAGNVTITIFIVESTETIVLHSKNLDIKKVYLEWPKSLPFTLNSKYDLLTVNTTKTLTNISTHELTIEFGGRLGDEMRGFYRSSYKHGNETRWMAVTQFESTYARTAFPCYDEPRYKTPFSISVGRPKSHTALSNTGTVSSYPDSDDSDLIWDQFATTPFMATYLVAFAVLDTQKYQTDGTNKFWARPNALEDTNYVSGIANKFFDFMEKYTQIPNIMKKTNFLAVPDFGAGAMENWGLITFRETLMLYHPELGTEDNLQRLTMTIAHEISHFWFGDLVTPVWWNYLWLNEAFARYFQFKLTKQLKTSWKQDQFYVVSSFQTALSFDTGQHALTKEVKTPDEINDLFDRITYDKGAAVLRMLEYAVTPETFKNSIRNYLRDAGLKSAGSVTADNLWAAFDTQVKTDNIELPVTVKELMKPWTKNPSYPLILVSRVPDENCIKIMQKTYRSLRASKPVENQEWIVPLTFTKQSKVNFTLTRPTVWLNNSREIYLHNEINGGEEWIIFNVQATGLYRVNYDEENWNLLIDQLHSNRKRIHPVNRAQLIDDSCSLATDRYICYHIPIGLLKYLDHETDVIPWYTAVERLSHIYSLFEHTHLGPLVKQYIHERLHHQYHNIGFSKKKDDYHLTKVFRTMFLNFACWIEFSHCIEDANKEYEKNVKDLSKIPADVKEAVLCTAHFHRANASMWQDLWGVYKSSNVASEKVTILRTLGCTTDAEHLRRYLYKTIDESDADIRRQDFSYVYFSCFRHAAGITAGLNLIRDLLPTIGEGLGGPHLNTRVTAMLNQLKSGIRQKEQIRQLEDLISRAEKLNKKPLANLIEAMKKAQKAAVKTQELIRGRTDSLEMALDDGNTGLSSVAFMPTTLSYATLIIFWLLRNGSVFSKFLFAT